MGRGRVVARVVGRVVGRAARACALVRTALAGGLMALVLALPSPVRAQDGDGDIEPDAVLPWHGIDFGATTFEYGFGTLVDWATYDQGANSEEQLDLEAKFILRDMRALFRGALRDAKGITWQTGIMWDNASGTLRFRQT